MGFITIVTDDESFEHRIGDSVFVLRRVPDDVTRRIFKRHTKSRPGREPETDYFAVTADVLDHAIVDWRGIKHPVTKEDLPCTRAYKVALPAGVKAEIMDAIDQGDVGADEEEIEKN